RQSVIQLEFRQKPQVLAALLAAPEMKRTLVFTRTKRGADRVAKYLARTGTEAAVIHGNKSQRQREVALAAFKDASAAVMIATDIAARGIDIDEVTHVINYDLPEVPEAYVHRIGRTARAGATGRAISLCCADERSLLKTIERLTRQAIPVEVAPDTTAVQAIASAATNGAASASEGEQGRSERSGQRRDNRNRRPEGRRNEARRNGSSQDRRQQNGSSRDGSAKSQRSGEARSAGQQDSRSAATAEPRHRRDDRRDERPADRSPRSANGDTNGHRGNRADRNERSADRRGDTRSGASKRTGSSQRRTDRPSRSGRGDEGLALAGMPFLAGTSTLRRPAKR
ncbi:MAG: hypothetical protein KDJ36_15635, partial [Hyphomicrobiaceae bacterium]|nr:hypothetical protein [Hyphomicrobiaceae bacterium]